MRALLILLALAACGDNRKHPGDGSIDMPDAPTDASTALGACLDQPSQMVIPAGTALPCDMLPPGFAP